MAKKQIRFGIIGCGLMGKEFASAVSRWCHLVQTDVEPIIIAACDVNLAATEWFKNQLPSVAYTTENYRDLLADKNIDAIYCAVPHNLHESIYIDIIRAKKHLLGEKPFGIDLKANQAILKAIDQHPNVMVRCSSELPFYPGGYRAYQFVQSGALGKIIEVEAGLWHSSDLNTEKPINWKRMIAFNGEYGCMGDLGMHALHLPLRFGWFPETVSAVLSNLVTERADKGKKMVPCETWDNAVLACEVNQNGNKFPMIISTKRIAPGHSNTWFIRIHGMDGSVEYSTKNPKEFKTMQYKQGGDQIWNTIDVPFSTAYPVITGGIFEFGFSDSILQMWAAFCDELVNGSDMKQPFYCATPQEALQSHKIFTAALESYHNKSTVSLN